MRCFLPVLALLLPILFSSCTGYQLGGHQPTALANIKSIHIPIVRNETQVPRAGAQATAAIAEALLMDGTYQLGSASQADARLEASLEEIDYRQVRSSRKDSLRSEELAMTVVYTWSLVRADNPLQVLQRGRSQGTTTFFVDPNLQTARQTALPDALKRASESMVARIADGF